MEKQPYEAPQLSSVGKVEDLTGGTGGNQTDQQGSTLPIKDDV